MQNCKWNVHYNVLEFKKKGKVWIEIKCVELGMETNARLQALLQVRED